MTKTTIIAAAALLLTACDFEQPPIGCPVQRITWSARFHLVPGQTVTGACTEKPGERLGIQKYNDLATDEDTLVIKPITLAALEGEDPDHATYSVGTFPKLPDAEDFCVAGELTEARQTVPSEGLDIAYQWTEVKILSRANAPGSQMVGKVLYTEGGCTAEYEVWAQWPAVYCGDDDDQPSDAICSEEGHGLNPEFASVCDPTSLYCVPAVRPPAFR